MPMYGENVYCKICGNLVEDEDDFIEITPGYICEYCTNEIKDFLKKQCSN